MRNVLGVLVLVMSVILALYVGLWLMFIKPIIACCVMFDAGILTALDVGICVLKCVFASFVGWVIFAIGTTLSVVIVDE